MTPQQFKRIAVLLKKVYAELEAEAVDSGLSVGSPEFQEALDKAREMVLNQNGFTIEQYREIKTKMNAYTPADLMTEFGRVAEKVDNLVVPTAKDIEDIATAVAKAHMKAPEIINRIVKEVVKEKPQIIKETTIEKTVQEVAYNEGPMKEEIAGLTKRIEDLPKPVNVELLKKEFETFFHDNFGANFQKNIDILGMPLFRQLAMGLREDVDTKITGVFTHKITVAAVAPSNPVLNDLWVDTS